VVSGYCETCGNTLCVCEQALHEVDVMPGMVIRPDDVLVISCTDQLTPERAKQLQDALMTRLPGLADVVVLAGPLSIGAVYRRNVEP
jgi:hypothetical protein